jgi:hypothetical protein
LFEEQPSSGTKQEGFITRPSIKKLVIEPAADEEETPTSARRGKDDSSLEISQETPTKLPTQQTRQQDRTTPTTLPKPVAREKPVLLLSKANEGYYTKPDVLLLSKLNKDELVQIENFVVGRQGIGSVQFPGKTDVTSLGDINTIVEFYPGEIVVYPDESKKPPVGEGLNKPAIVTLEKVFSVLLLSQGPLYFI